MGRVWGGGGDHCRRLGNKAGDGAGEGSDRRQARASGRLKVGNPGPGGGKEAGRAGGAALRA